MENLYEPQLLFYAGATLLEGPSWNKRSNKLLFVSIEQKCIYLLNMNNGEIKTYIMNGQVGCALFQNEDYILAAEYTGIYKIHIETGEKQLMTQLNYNSKLRYNDGILDAKGRFLVGTTGYQCFTEFENCLYSWDGKECKVLIDNVSISNGIDFSSDNQFMYFVDTPTKKVSRYFYDLDTGEIRFDKNVIYIQDGGVPDGICTDIDDMLWVAEWGGGKVSKWNPNTGEKILEIGLPCMNVSSCCIGGENNSYLFVTTAQHDDGSKSEGLAGGLFKIRIR